MVRQLLARGLLAVARRLRHPGADRGSTAVLRGDRTVALRREAPRAARARAAKKSRAADAVALDAVRRGAVRAAAGLASASPRRPGCPRT